MVPPTENIKKDIFVICVMCLLYPVTVYVIGSNKVYLNFKKILLSWVFWPFAVAYILRPLSFGHSIVILIFDINVSHKHPQKN